ncbi:hypothetical protein ABZP36_013765 [Zizania latifolia]
MGVGAVAQPQAGGRWRRLYATGSVVASPIGFTIRGQLRSSSPRAIPQRRRRANVKWPPVHKGKGIMQSRPGMGDQEKENMSGWEKIDFFSFHGCELAPVGQ